MTHNLITCNLENMKNRFNVRNSTVTLSAIKQWSLLENPKKGP